MDRIVHDEIVIDLDDSERQMLPTLKGLFETDNFKANVRAAKNYFDFEELKI